MSHPRTQNALLAFVAEHPGATCQQAANGLPHIPRSSIRSVLSLLASSGRLATRGQKSHRHYFATAKLAQAWVEPVKRVIVTLTKRMRHQLPYFLAQRPKGSSTSDICQHFGCSTSHVCRLGMLESRAGRIFRSPVPVGQGFLYFASVDDMNAAAQALVAAREAFLKEQHERALLKQRAWAKAAYVPAPPKPKPAPKVAAPKPIAPPKPKTAQKPPASLMRHAGSAVYIPAAPPKRGPAALQCEPDFSAARVIRAPTPAGRYEVPKDFRGAFSSVGVGRDVQTGSGW